TANRRTFNLGSTDVKLFVEFEMLRTPFVSPLAVVSAASFQPGPIAPGEGVTLFGFNLGGIMTLAQLDSDGRVARQLNGTRVLFDGVPAPIVYSSSSQAR